MKIVVKVSNIHITPTVHLMIVRSCGNVWKNTNACDVPIPKRAVAITQPTNATPNVKSKCVGSPGMRGGNPGGRDIVKGLAGASDTQCQQGAAKSRRTENIKRRAPDGEVDEPVYE